MYLTRIFDFDRQFIEIVTAATRNIKYQIDQR